MTDTKQSPNPSQPSELSDSDLLKLRNIFNTIIQCNRITSDQTAISLLLNYAQLGELIQQKFLGIPIEVLADKLIEAETKATAAELETINAELKIINDELKATEATLTNVKTRLQPLEEKMEETYVLSPETAELQTTAFRIQIDIGIITRRKNKFEQNSKQKQEKLNELKENKEINLFDVTPRQDQKKITQHFLNASALIEKFEKTTYTDTRYQSNKKNVCDSTGRGLWSFKILVGKKDLQKSEAPDLLSVSEQKYVENFFEKYLIPSNPERQKIDKMIDEIRSHALSLTDKEAQKTALELCDGYTKNYSDALGSHNYFYPGLQQLSDQYFSTTIGLETFQKRCRDLINNDRYKILNNHRGLQANSAIRAIGRVIAAILSFLSSPYLLYRKEDIHNFSRRTKTNFKAYQAVAAVERLGVFKATIPVRATIPEQKIAQAESRMSEAKTDDQKPQP